MANQLSAGFGLSRNGARTPQATYGSTTCAGDRTLEITRVARTLDGQANLLFGFHDSAAVLITTLFERWLMASCSHPLCVLRNNLSCTS